MIIQRPSSLGGAPYISAYRDSFLTASGTTLVIPFAPAAVGDLMLVAVVWHYNSTMNAPAGWTIAGSNSGGGSQPCVAVYQKIKTGTEGTSFTFSTGSSAIAARSMTVPGGGLISNNASTLNTTFQAALTAPAVFSSIPDSLSLRVLALMGAGNDPIPTVAWNDPAWNAYPSVTSNTPNYQNTLAMAAKPQPLVNNTGVGSATASRPLPCASLTLQIPPFLPAKTLTGAARRITKPSTQTLTANVKALLTPWVSDPSYPAPVVAGGLQVVGDGAATLLCEVSRGWWGSTYTVEVLVNGVVAFTFTGTGSNEVVTPPSTNLDLRNGDVIGMQAIVPTNDASGLQFTNNNTRITITPL